MADPRPDARAEAILRDRLTPAQLADFNITGWFNTRDAHGYAWRVRGQVSTNTRDDTIPGCTCAICANRYPNLIDFAHEGRTMYAYGPHRIPIADEALALLLHLADPALAALVHLRACATEIPRAALGPHSRAVRRAYVALGEGRLAPGRRPPPPPTGVLREVGGLT